MLLDIVFSVSDDLLAADQAAAAVFDVGQSPEAVMLQLEEPIVVVKWSRDARRIDGEIRGSIV
jgi:hypothetical protein